MAEAYSRSRKANWLGKKNLESRVRGIFQRDDAPGIGAVQMTSERVARGAGPVQLLGGAHRGANRKRHFSATPTTRQHVHGRRFYGAIPAPSSPHRRPPSPITRPLSHNSYPTHLSRL